MLPAATDSSLTPLFDTTPAAITCWQTKRNVGLYSAVTPVFDTTSQKRVRIDYRITLLIPPRNLIDCAMKPYCFPQAFLLFLQKQVPDFAKETYGQFVQKKVWKGRASSAAISYSILPLIKPFCSHEVLQAIKQPDVGEIPSVISRLSPPFTGGQGLGN